MGLDGCSKIIMLRWLLLLALPCLALSAAVGGYGGKRKRRAADNEVVYVSKEEMDSLVENLDSIEELKTELKEGKEEKKDEEAEKQRKALEDQKKTKPKQYGLEPPRFDQWMAMHSPYMQSMGKDGNYFGYDLNRAQGNSIWKDVGGVLFSGMSHVKLEPMLKVPVVKQVPLGFSGRNKRSTDYGYSGYNAGYGHYPAYGYGGYPAYGYDGYSGYGPYYGYGGYRPYNYYGDYYGHGYGGYGYGYGNYGYGYGNYGYGSYGYPAHGGYH